MSSDAGGGRLAWVETQRGVANVWVAEDGDWQPKKVTHFTADDGVGVDFLAFSRDGDSLIFSGGPSAGNNPTHLTKPPAEASTFVAWLNGTVSKVADRALAAISPDSQSFVYTTSGENTEVWEQKLDANAEPHRLFAVKQGSISALTWRKDGGALAFSNDRGDHGFVGVYSPTSDRLMWVAPGVDTDMNPVWSAGGKLAWIRAQVHAGNPGFGPSDGNMGNRGPDFSVMVAELSERDGQLLEQSHSVREVFTDLEYGALTFGYGSRPLLWIGEDRLVFGTEAVSEWSHAVIVDLNESKPQAIELRPGNCEDAAWTLEGDWLYISNNCQNIDSSGLERVHLVSREREVVVAAEDEYTVAGMASAGTGVVPLPGGRLGVLRSRHNESNHVHVVTPGEEPSIERVTMDIDFAGAAAFQKPTMITFPSEDGKFEIHAQLFLPASASTGEGIVYTHGGSERQMYGGMHFSATYGQHYAMCQYQAYRGSAVISVNYRSGTGYGHKFRVCHKCKDRGAAEYQDVREAAIQLGNRSEVDSSRIGIWGLSYGGLNAEQACARDSGIFKACASIAGIWNWITSNRYVTDTGLGVIDSVLEPSFGNNYRSLPMGPEPNEAGPAWFDKVQKVQRIQLESSPAGHAINLTSPMLLIQGDADEEVDFQETIGAVRQMRALGRKNVEFAVVPDESHGFSTYHHQTWSLRLADEFLQKHLAADTAELLV